MNLDDVKKIGGMVPADLVPCEEVWKHQDESGEPREDLVQFFVKRISFGALERALRPDRTLDNVALIVESIRLGDQGEQQFTHELAQTLAPSLASCFARAAAKVNSLGGESDPKNLPKKTSSGMNSSSQESADEPSAKQKSV